MIKKEVLLSQDNVDYLKHFQNLRNISSTNQAIRTIIEQHQLYFSQTDGSVGQIIAAIMQEKYSELLRAIRASAQTSERNTEIILELFNTLFLNHFTKISHALLRSLYECDPIAEARKSVQEKIAEQRQKKLFRS